VEIVFGQGLLAVAGQPLEGCGWLGPASCVSEEIKQLQQRWAEEAVGCLFLVTDGKTLFCLSWWGS